MSRNKIFLWGIIGVVCVCIVGILALLFFGNPLFKEISISDFEKIVNSGEKAIVYYGQDCCRDCQKFHPIVEEYVDSENGSGLYYFNIKDFRDRSKAEDAKEADIQFYKDLTDKFDISWVPCVCHIVNGKIESKYEFLSKEYYEIEDETEKEKVVEEYVTQFVLWMTKSQGN